MKISHKTDLELEYISDEKVKIKPYLLDLTFRLAFRLS